MQALVIKICKDVNKGGVKPMRGKMFLKYLIIFTVFFCSTLFQSHFCLAQEIELHKDYSEQTKDLLTKSLDENPISNYYQDFNFKQNDLKINAPKAPSVNTPKIDVPKKVSSPPRSIIIFQEPEKIEMVKPIIEPAGPKIEIPKQAEEKSIQDKTSKVDPLEKSSVQEMPSEKKAVTDNSKFEEEVKTTQPIEIKRPVFREQAGKEKIKTPTPTSKPLQTKAPEKVKVTLPASKNNQPEEIKNNTFDNNENLIKPTTETQETAKAPKVINGEIAGEDLTDVVKSITTCLDNMANAPIIRTSLQEVYLELMSINEHQILGKKSVEKINLIIKEYVLINKNLNVVEANSMPKKTSTYFTVKTTLHTQSATTVPRYIITVELFDVNNRLRGYWSNRVVF